MTPLDLIIDGLAIYRLSRLITVDTFPPILRARAWIVSRWPSDDTIFLESEIVQGETGPVTRHGVSVFSTAEGWLPVRSHWFGELVTCIYCASVWVAVIVVALRFGWGAWQWPALVLGLSAVAGLIHRES